MIKVILHGDEHKKTECKHCKCEFEYDLADVIDDGWNGMGYLFCPECGEEIKVENVIRGGINNENPNKTKRADKPFG